MPCGVGREGLAWRGKAGWVPTRAGLVDGDQSGQGLGGGGKGFGSGGVGGRDTGPRDGANFATYVVFLSFLTRTKRRKNGFFLRMPCGVGGGCPPELAWWTGGLQERVGGGVGAMAVPKKGELVGCSKEGKGSGKGWLGGRGGCNGFGCGGKW